MRWFWIDRFTSFESGRQATAIKSVSLMEEYLDGYFDGYPVMTPSFVLEGFAQVGGILISQASEFRHNVVLAKVSRSKIHRYARPGEQLKYSVTLESLQVDGGLVRATSQIDDELQIEAELTFAYVSSDVIDRRFFAPHELLRLLRAYRLFDVAVDSEGNPLKIPDYLLEAEADLT
jgi:3-hydroxymyristoyl/3-hydroxydecanoyl-(acyl carrier protein) dehydratase